MTAKENLLKEFDFEKVAKVMGLLGWKYYDTVGDKVTVDELKTFASNYIDRFLEEDHRVDSISSGGFVVSWEWITEERKVPKLEFILETGYGFEDSDYEVDTDETVLL